MKKFKCPKCGCERIEEVAIDACISYEITEITKEGDCEYGNCIVDDATTDRYQCVGCGNVLEDEEGSNIIDLCEVAEWIEKNC